MTAQQIPALDLAGAVKRQWWIVVLAAVVALVVAFAASSAVKPSHTATGTLRIGPAALSHAFNAPTPDDMVRASAAEIHDALEVQGFSADELATVRFAALGAPQTRITLTAEAADAARAKQLVDAAGKQAVVYARAATAVEIARQTRQIEIAKAAIRDGADIVTSYEGWAIQSSLIDAENGLKTVENIYVWDGNTDLVTTSRLQGMQTTLAASLLLGAFVGLILAGVREYLWRRKNASVASA